MLARKVLLIKISIRDIIKLCNIITLYYTFYRSSNKINFVYRINHISLVSLMSTCIDRKLNLLMRNWHLSSIFQCHMKSEATNNIKTFRFLDRTFIDLKEEIVAAKYLGGGRYHFWFRNVAHDRDEYKKLTANLQEEELVYYSKNN